MSSFYPWLRADLFWLGLTVKSFAWLAAPWKVPVKIWTTVHWALIARVEKWTHRYEHTILYSVHSFVWEVRGWWYYGMAASAAPGGFCLLYFRFYLPNDGNGYESLKTVFEIGLLNDFYTLCGNSCEVKFHRIQLLSSCWCDVETFQSTSMEHRVKFSFLLN